MPYNSNISRSDAAGTIPMDYSNEFAKAIAEKSAVLQLSRRLRDMAAYQRTLPVLSALATAYFVNGDIGLKKTTELNWADKVITAEEIAAIVPIPEAVFEDSTIDMWAEVKNDLVTALGVAIDNAILYGTNKPATWPTAIVTAAIAAGNSVALGTGADLYDDILGEDGLLTEIEQDGYMHNGHLGAMVMRGKLRSVRDADGNPIFSTGMQEAQQYFLDGTPIIFPRTGVMGSSYPLISGDFTQHVYSMRKDMTWKIATEGVIQDQSGNIVYNLFQQDMIALRVVMRLGTQLPNPINRENEVEANRYPFAVLTDL